MKTISSIIDYLYDDRTDLQEHYRWLDATLETFFDTENKIKQLSQRVHLAFHRFKLLAKILEGRCIDDCWISQLKDSLLQAKLPGAYLGIRERLELSTLKKLSEEIYRRHIGLHLFEYKNEKFTGNLNIDATIRWIAFEIIEPILTNYIFPQGVISFGDRLEDISMLESAQISVAINPTHELEQYAKERNWLIFREGQDLEKLLFQIEWRRRYYPNNPYKINGLKPPAYLDIDNTLVNGHVLIQVIDDLFPSESGFFRDVLASNQPYDEIVNTVLNKYYQLYETIKPDEFASKAKASIKKTRFFTYTAQLMDYLHEHFQPILDSLEPTHILQLLDEFPMFKDCLILERPKEISKDTITPIKREYGGGELEFSFNNTIEVLKKFALGKHAECEYCKDKPSS